MDFSKTPIAKFFKYCLFTAKRKEYKWVLCLLAREADIDGLYDNLKQDWDSLDSITGDDFLFVVAGYRDSSIRLDEVIKIILNSESIKEILKSVLNSTFDISKNQTYAVNDLKNYLKIPEKEIPCIVITSLDSMHNYHAEIKQNEIYRYIKALVISINTHSKMLEQYEKNEEYDKVKNFMNDVIKQIDG